MSYTFDAKTKPPNENGERCMATSDQANSDTVWLGVIDAKGVDQAAAPAIHGWHGAEHRAGRQPRPSAAVQLPGRTRRGDGQATAYVTHRPAGALERRRAYRSRGGSGGVLQQAARREDGGAPN
jgi:hypothetical protein